MRRSPLVLVAALILSTPGCVRPMDERSSMGQVDTRVALVFGAAVTAVALLDGAETAYLDSKRRLTDEEDAAAAERVALLRACHATLQRVRDHLDSEDPRPSLKQLFQDARALLQLAQAAGLPLNADKVSQQLAVVEGFIR